MDTQATLHFGPVVNSGMFSNHWLDRRLSMEPEWADYAPVSKEALDKISALWKRERGRVEKYRDEQGLENAFIQPVLEALGWTYKYQTYIQDREPDYALFLDDTALDAALNAGRTAPDFWRFPVALADAKAWHIPLDQPVKSKRGARKEYPPQQIEWYLDRTRLDFGILTNGRLWRLMPRELGPQQRRFDTYLEIDLGALLDDWAQATDLRKKDEILHDFGLFFLFFGPAGFREVQGGKPLLRRALEGSTEYRLGVGEDLKERTFEALRYCIEGFLTYAPNKLHPEWEMEPCRDQSFILLYRLLFIMYAEDRRLLPYRVNRIYTENRSLGRHRDEIAGRLDRLTAGARDDYSPDATDLWDDLQVLFDLVDGGHKTYGVPEYNGGLFSRDEHPHLNTWKLPDWYMARVIDQLGRSGDPYVPHIGLVRVDYFDLAIQHLGTVYEGLLELHPKWTNEKLVVVSRTHQGRTEERYIRDSEATPSGFTRTDKKYPPKSIYLENRKGERRESGSYYTPDHIVNYIVEQTLGLLCQRANDDLNAEIAKAELAGNAADLARLRADFDRRILELRILDPAMGSGHFLLRACQYLAEEIATNPHTRESAAAAGAAEASLSHWKRQVVEKCLFGVDMNALAVELAKLALWLETVAANQPLSFLDHHLRYGNSLIGARLERMGALPTSSPLQAAKFEGAFRQQLPALLQHLGKIREQPSESAKQVKEKVQLYRRFEAAREPFRAVSELWCSDYAAPSGLGISDDHYQAAVDVVASPQKFKKLSEEDWFKEAIARARHPSFRPFTWELEFPEVFFAGDGPHSSPGFDGIIGNPPYDVLSELENDTDLTAFRAVIDDNPEFAPSSRKKNNLYKLFVCKALALLGDGGYFGFIVPMPILGDDQAVGIRREMVRVGAFKAIEAFPQKDNPRKRVFPEAKQSTAVFIFAKDKHLVGEDCAFRSRVHDGRLFEETSRQLTLTTSAIPLYDPSNFTIVSCDQADWDLAVRIMSTGRLGRLGTFCVSYQGEVNEKVKATKAISQATRTTARLSCVVPTSAYMPFARLRKAACFTYAKMTIFATKTPARKPFTAVIIALDFSEVRRKIIFDA